MNRSEYMYTIAELGVGLSGFAALIIAIRRRSESSLSDSDRDTVTALIERGLMAAFLSLLPVLLFGLGLSEPLLWTVSSGVFVIYGITIPYRALRLRKELIKNGALPKAMFYGLTGLATAVVILQLLHAVGVGMQQSAWWYGVGITWLLAAAGHRFLYLVQRWFREQ
jgi:hypothetical protein